MREKVLRWLITLSYYFKLNFGMRFVGVFLSIVNNFCCYCRYCFLILFSFPLNSLSPFHAWLNFCIFSKFSIYLSNSNKSQAFFTVFYNSYNIFCFNSVMLFIWLFFDWSLCFIFHWLLIHIFVTVFKKFFYFFFLRRENITCLLTSNCL